MTAIPILRAGRIGCLGAVLAAVVHCAPSKDPRADDVGGTGIVLERFPSTRSSETGVNQWDVGDVTTPDGRFFVARGYKVENGARAFVMEIVSRVDAPGDWSVRGEPRLGEAQARAVARDVEAMSAVLRPSGTGTAEIVPKNIGIRAPVGLSQHRPALAVRRPAHRTAPGARRDRRGRAPRERGPVAPMRRRRWGRGVTTAIETARA